MHKNKPLVPDPSPSEFEIPTEQMKRFKTPRVDQIPAEPVQPGDNKLRFKSDKRINSFWNME